MYAHIPLLHCQFESNHCKNIKVGTIIHPLNKAIDLVLRLLSPNFRHNKLMDGLFSLFYFMEKKYFEEPQKVICLFDMCLQQYTSHNSNICVNGFMFTKKMSNSFLLAVCLLAIGFHLNFSQLPTSDLGVPLQYVVSLSLVGNRSLFKKI